MRKSNLFVERIFLIENSGLLRILILLQKERQFARVADFDYFQKKEERVDKIVECFKVKNDSMLPKHLG